MSSSSATLLSAALFCRERISRIDHATLGRMLWRDWEKRRSALAREKLSPEDIESELRYQDELLDGLIDNLEVIRAEAHRCFGGEAGFTNGAPAIVAFLRGLQQVEPY